MHCTVSGAASAQLAAVTCLSDSAEYAKPWIRPADQRSLKTAHATTHQIWNGAICDAASNSCIWLVWACWHLDDVWKESQTFYDVMHS